MEDRIDSNCRDAEDKPESFPLQRKFQEQSEIGDKKQYEQEAMSYPEALPLFISCSL